MSEPTMAFSEFFRTVTDAGYEAHGWQLRLAEDSTCRSRLIRIPTGFGKTAGVVLAWLWNRVYRDNGDWPRRLVLCLPMRTLVEQTENAVSKWLSCESLPSHPPVHVLMGGLSPSDWHLAPQGNAVIIGTQDMLLSRALNRGYGAGRARWPVEYGLLNVDCLWVMDEIQLMDVGLATSAQLQGFADSNELEGRQPRPRRTWWMSATLQQDWLAKAPNLSASDKLPILELLEDEKVGSLWTVDKSIRVESIPATDDPKAAQWANLIAKLHAGQLTIAVANTVKSGINLRRELEGLRKNGQLSSDVDICLVHSRFRGAERREWTNEFLRREQGAGDYNRIIVATQVIEAGVDISADVLVTELAPWAALVQRWGRCARYGGSGQVVIVDRRHSDESAKTIAAKDEDERARSRAKKDREIALPYELEGIRAAAEAIVRLEGKANPVTLDSFQQAETQRDGLGMLPQLYPYSPLHVLRNRELRDLFDTGPDLTGADVDISRFVREGDDRDVTIWWWPVPKGEIPHQRLRPTHDALCRVPVGDARKWLFQAKQETGDTQSEERPSTAENKRLLRAWAWSYLDGAWEWLEQRHVFPGQTILVDRDEGGYNQSTGFTGKPGWVSVERGHVLAANTLDAADSAEEHDELSEGVQEAVWQYKSIATHAVEVAETVQQLIANFGLEESTSHALNFAALFHDIGKAHPAFANAIKDRNDIPPETVLAKAPKGRWQSIRGLYNHSIYGRRPSFRHELASTLALTEYLWRIRPDHEALQGICGSILEATIGRELPDDNERISEQGILASLAALGANEFNLVLYLVMCHHGKVRATIAMSPRDQDNPAKDGSLPIRGIREEDCLPCTHIATAIGEDCRLPPVTLHLDLARIGLSKRYGPSWVERVLQLRERFGDFQLAWLESLIRAADVGASCIAAPLDARIPAGLVTVAAIPPSDDQDAELREWIERSLLDRTLSPTSKPGATRSKKPAKRPSTRNGRSAS